MISEYNKKSTIYMCFAAIFLGLFGAAGKHFSGLVTPELVLLFSRTLILLGLVPIIFSKKVLELKTRFFSLHFLHALLIVGAFYSFFRSIIHIPISTALLLFCSSALFVPFIALFEVEKKLSAKKLSGLIIAICGFILIMQPHKDLFQVAILYAMLSGILMSASKLINKQLHLVEPNFRINFYLIAMSFIIATLPALFTIKNIQMFLSDLDFSIYPTLNAFFTLGLIYWAFKLLHSKAMSFERSIFVELFAYLSILVGGFIDWYMWKTIPNALAIAGMFLVILGSAISAIKYHKSLHARK